MDFRTDPINRERIRIIAEIVRTSYGVKEYEPFDVLGFLELTTYFDDVTVEIVENGDYRVRGIPATIQEGNGEYTIIIKESVYDAAYNNNGGCRMHIMHEISHYLLFRLGFKPYHDRAYKNYELRPYESIEWHAKALAGEILIPYE